MPREPPRPSRASLAPGSPIGLTLWPSVDRVASETGRLGAVLPAVTGPTQTIRDHDAARRRGCV